LITRYNLSDDPDQLSDQAFELKAAQAMRFRAEDRALLLSKKVGAELGNL